MLIVYDVNNESGIRNINEIELKNERKKNKNEEQVKMNKRDEEDWGFDDNCCWKIQVWNSFIIYKCIKAYNFYCKLFYDLKIKLSFWFWMQINETFIFWWFAIMLYFINFNNINMVSF